MIIWRALEVYTVTDDPTDLSAEFLLAIRRGEDSAALADELAGMNAETLAATLDSDAARSAFWINIYNAATQRALDTNPEQYENRREFFTSPLITIASRPFSLDAIEHGILRRSYSKFTIGYVRTPARVRSAVADRFAVSERDPRIHFALNCGAQSCPPIAAYTTEEIDTQLEMATRGYLDQTVDYDPDARDFRARLFGDGRAVVPRAMLWFRGDFGGKAGLIQFLQQYDQIPDGTTPRLSYHDWDWSFDPADYTDVEYAPGDETAAASFVSQKTD